MRRRWIPASHPTGWTCVESLGCVVTALIWTANRRPLIPVVATTMLLALSLATSAHAQIIRGIVLDAQSKSPIDAVDVVLLARDDRVVSRYVSDKGGRFSIRLRETGSYVLRASRIGYAPLTTGIISLEPEQEAVAELHLEPLAMPLDPIEARTARVRPGSQRLERVGFYQRKRTGLGHFLTAADIEARHLVYPEDLFTGMPGVRVAPDGRVLATSSYRACALGVAIDGLVVERGGYGLVVERGGSSWAHLVNVNDIQAVEVFPRPAGVPPWMGARYCGAILIWRKGFER